MQEDRKTIQFNEMTNTKIPKLILKLAIPNIVAMLITAAYNMADTLFVSQIGTSAAGAVGIVFSIMTIIQAIGFMIGQGSGSIVSILLGQKDYKTANKYTSTSFFMSIALGMVIAIIGLWFLEDFMRLLGATPTILPYAKEYAIYMLIGAPILTGTFVINNLLRYQGLAALSMIGISIGAIINIILDPILIFGFSMGITGAAIATLFSEIISFLILLYFMLFNKKNILKIKIKYISKDIKDYIKIMKVGFPSFCRQGLSSVGTVALNVTAAGYSDATVAAMSIVTRIFLFLVSAMIGFVQGYQAVAGVNFGAKRYKRLRQSYKFCFIFGTATLTLLGILGFIFAEPIIKLFRADDIEVITIGARAFRAQCISMPLQTLIILTNMTFQVIGRSKESAFLSSLRQGIVFFPLILLLPTYFGLFGLEITQAVSDVVSSLIYLPFLYVLFKHMPTKDFCPEQEDAFN